MTSSFASLFLTTFLVMASLHSTFKITSSTTDAKQQEQYLPHHQNLRSTADNHRTSRLLSRRRCLFTTSTTATCTPDYTHQSSFRLEITTDQNPTEIAWVLSDAKTNKVLHSVEEGDDKYNRLNSFYQQSYFLQNSGFCYHFQITVEQHDDTCCALDNGLYHAFYDDKLLMQGSNFGESEASVLFGDTTCTTSFPQTSTTSSSSPLETSVLPGAPTLASTKRTLSSAFAPPTSAQPELLPFLSPPSKLPSVTLASSSRQSSSLSSNLPPAPSSSSSSLSVLESSNKPSSSSKMSPIKMVPKLSRTQQTLSPMSCIDPTQALFKFEIMTDDYPTDTSWTLTDVNSNDIIISVDAGTYSNTNSLYEKSYCIDSTVCYQFTIFDWFEDGICCSQGNGYYKISYEETLLQEGGDFGYSQTSALLFGNGCPSSLPSESPVPSSAPSSAPSSTPSLSVQPSSNPTLSLKPSVEPSLSPSSSVEPSNTPSLSVKPSSNPTLSLKPSDEPSWSPTTSSIPTSSPDQNTNLIALDEYNRRYFYFPGESVI